MSPLRAAALTHWISENERERALRGLLCNLANHWTLSSQATTAPSQILIWPETGVLLTKWPTSLILDCLLFLSVLRISLSCSDSPATSSSLCFSSCPGRTVSKALCFHSDWRSAWSRAVEGSKGKFCYVFAKRGPKCRTLGRRKQKVSINNIKLNPDNKTDRQQTQREEAEATRTKEECTKNNMAWHKEHRQEY